MSYVALYRAARSDSTSPPRLRFEATPLYRAVLGAARRKHGCDSSAATIPHTLRRLERRGGHGTFSSRARDADRPLARCAPSRDARGTPRCDAMRTSSLLRRTHRLPPPDHPTNHRRAPTHQTTASPRARRRPNHPKTFAAAIDLARVLRAEAETMPEVRASPRKGVCHTSSRTNACCEPRRRRCPRWVRHQEKACATHHHARTRNDVLHALSTAEGRTGARRGAQKRNGAARRLRGPCAGVPRGRSHAPASHGAPSPASVLGSSLGARVSGAARGTEAEVLSIWTSMTVLYDIPLYDRHT